LLLLQAWRVVGVASSMACGWRCFKHGVWLALLQAWRVVSRVVPTF
jgi:hypothetical protein